MHVVLLRNSTFEPADLTIAVDEMLLFRHRDGALNHTVESSDYTFGAGLLVQPQEFGVRLERAGTFEFHCNLHPGMAGRVTVVGTTAG